jgi:hypothetical protein
VAQQLMADDALGVMPATSWPVRDSQCSSTPGGTRVGRDVYCRAALPILAVVVAPSSRAILVVSGVSLVCPVALAMQDELGPLSSVLLTL